MRITCCHFIYVVISICVWNKCSSYVEYAHKSVPYRNVLISRPIDSETYGFERWVSFLLYFSTLFSWTGTEIDTLRGEKLVFPMNLGRIIDDNLRHDDDQCIEMTDKQFANSLQHDLFLPARWKCISVPNCTPINEYTRIHITYRIILLCMFKSRSLHF